MADERPLGDNDPYKGHACELCGDLVPVSKGEGFWTTDPKSMEVTAWHLICLLDRK